MIWVMVRIKGLACTGSQKMGEILKNEKGKAKLYKILLGDQDPVREARRLVHQAAIEWGGWEAYFPDRYFNRSPFSSLNLSDLGQQNILLNPTHADTIYLHSSNHQGWVLRRDCIRPFPMILYDQSLQDKSSITQDFWYRMSNLREIRLRAW